MGTISVEKSERLSGILKKMGVKHEVLNAKNHEREAFIVAQAGRKGAVTVSTNMAGRGTDILLGGNPEFLTKEYLKKQNKDPDLLQTARRIAERTEWDQVYDALQGETAANTTKWSRWAACTCSARNGTNPAASIISCADAPDARATPAARASIFRCKTI